MPIPHFWDPEEAIGSAWHDIVRQWGGEPDHAAARVDYDSVRTAASVMFHAAGGVIGVDILPSAASVSRNRISAKRRLGHDVDHVTRASYDGLTLARTAWITSSSRRARFSSGPPQRSVRWLLSGERNWLNR